MSFSPKRLHLFSSKLQETGGVTLQPLCPTRWTARIPATEAFLTDYTLLLETLEQVHSTPLMIEGICWKNSAPYLDFNLVTFCSVQQSKFHSHYRGKI